MDVHTSAFILDVTEAHRQVPIARCDWHFFRCQLMCSGRRSSFTQKTAGNDTVAWVGFELLHRSCKIGISQRRGERFTPARKFLASACLFIFSHKTFLCLQSLQSPERVVPCCERARKTDTRRSQWFSHEITKDDCPRVFEKRRSTRPAHLEVLLVLKVYCGETPPRHRSKVLMARKWTDTRGNGGALYKLTTSTFPATALLMELPKCLRNSRLDRVKRSTLASGDHRGPHPKSGIFFFRRSFCFTTTAEKSLFPFPPLSVLSFLQLPSQDR